MVRQGLTGPQRTYLSRSYRDSVTRTYVQNGRCTYAYVTTRDAPVTCRKNLFLQFISFYFRGDVTAHCVEACRLCHADFGDWPDTASRQDCNSEPLKEIT